jgi:hypothetical protein
MVSPAVPVAGPAPRTAVGGLDVPAALASQVNLRILRTPLQNFNFRQGVRESVRIPNIGYIKNLRLIIKGTLRITTPTGTATAGDGRRLLRQLTTTFQGSNRPHDLDGVAESIWNTLDTPVVSNKIVFPSGALAAGDYPVYLEFTPLYGISETNLLGILYIGGESTYASLDVTMGAGNEAVALTGGATAELVNGSCDVYMEWIDEREPIPESTIPGSDNNPPTYVPGQGLWRETSMLKFVQLHDTIQLTSANQDWSVELPRGPIYNRVGLLFYDGNAIDADDSLMNTFELVSQQIASIRRETVDSLDEDFRKTYLKTRPPGFQVMTFLDKTGSDRDLLHSGGLGRLQLKGRNSAQVPPAGSKIMVYTETLVSLARNAGF